MQFGEESVRPGGDLGPRPVARRSRGTARRELAGLLIFGVGIYTWALFPSTNESGLKMPHLPDGSALRIAKIDSLRGGAPGEDTFEPSRTPALRLIDVKLPSSETATDQPVAAQSPSPVVDIGAVSMRDKLAALLMLLHFRPADGEREALRAKLEALLALPDSVLAQLMAHPDLVDLNNTLNDVFRGASDLSDLTAEFGKVDVTSLPGPAGRIDVVRVNGDAILLVHTTSVRMRTEQESGPVAAELSPAPAEAVTVTILSPLQAASNDLFAAALPMVTPAAQPPPPPEPAAPAMTAMVMAQPSEQFTPTTVSSADPSSGLGPSAASSGSVTTVATVEPSGSAVVSQDIMATGNKFEPGDTVAGTPGADSSPATERAAPTAAPTVEESTAAIATAPETHGAPETAGGQTSPPDGNADAGAAASP